MKRPAFQFYPGDWRKNAKLRRCTPAARGVWVDVLCLFHDAEEEYGVLRWPLKDIANAAGASMAHVRELVEKSVLKGADREAPAYVYRPKHAGKVGEPVILVIAEGGPVWYSSRMVRDEWVRQKRGGTTRFDTDHQPETRSPKGGIGGGFGDGPSTSTSSSSSPSGTNTSIPVGTGAETPKTAEKSPADLEAARVWLALKQTLVAQKTCGSTKEAGTLIGKLASKYGKDVFLEAGQATLGAEPADAHSYLVAVCEVAAGKRQTLGKQALTDEQRDELNAKSTAEAMAKLGIPTGDIIDA